MNERWIFAILYNTPISKVTTLLPIATTIVALILSLVTEPPLRANGSSQSRSWKIGLQKTYFKKSYFCKYQVEYAEILTSNIWYVATTCIWGDRFCGYYGYWKVLCFCFWDTLYSSYDLLHSSTWWCLRLHHICSWSTAHIASKEATQLTVPFFLGSMLQPTVWWETCWFVWTTESPMWTCQTWWTSQLEFLTSHCVIKPWRFNYSTVLHYYTIDFIIPYCGIIIHLSI